MIAVGLINSHIQSCMTHWIYKKSIEPQHCMSTSLKCSKTLLNAFRVVFYATLQNIPIWKLNSYLSPTIHRKPWESIFMDFLRGSPSSKLDNDYMFVVVDWFTNMIVLIPCKKIITGEETGRLFFIYVSKYFGIPSSIISSRDSWFLGHF